MRDFENLKAFAYRLASAALRVGVVLGVALPLIALAVRPWRTSEQVANESSGKRPAEVRFETVGVNTLVPFEIVGAATLGTDCTEVAVRNRSSVDVCIWWVDADTVGDCTTPGYNCSAITVTDNLWLIETGDDSFTTRYPIDSERSPISSNWELCLDPSAAAAGAADIVFISCLKN